MISLSKLPAGVTAGLALSAITCLGQTALPVYTDGLQSGFQDWSWAPARNLNNTSPVHLGSKSISASPAYWEGLSFWHADLDTAPYASFSFWVHGGTGGGQRLQVYAQYGSSSGPVFALPSLVANTWQQHTIALSTLGIANVPNFNRINFQLTASGTSGTFYLDDIQFNPNAPPAVVNVSLNATQAIQQVDERHFGVNLAMWDEYYDPPHHITTTALLQEMGSTVVRMPGGSLSDEYHFDRNVTLQNTWQWQASFPDFMRVYTNAVLQGFVTVNYGSGSPQEAAAWVAYANGNAALYGTANDITIGTDAGGRNWQTVGYWARLRSQTPAQNPDNAFDFLAIGRAAPFGIKYWEIGNECYGTWERDTNSPAHHAYTYATRATNYIARMKAVDPSIKIGVVAVPGESSYSNNYTDHPAYNSRTRETNYGWTPVMLTTLRNLGVTPDFLVHHVYPQWTNPNNPASTSVDDVTLLQSTKNWAADAADLRQQITDYSGPDGTNVQLVCTENNADAGAQGRQSTSLVNGLYYADSLAHLLKTEFKGFVWWDLRNGTDTGGFFGPNLYGWRTYGDLGMINGASTRHPSFYAAKLMQYFARPGDRILTASSDYPYLAAHLARRQNGSLALLLINKSLSADLNAQIVLHGFSPASHSNLRSYGISNDEAARTNAPLSAQDITTGSISNAASGFSFNAPKMSLTVFSLTPIAPSITVVPTQSGSNLAVRIEGQADVPYVLQYSTNLASWFSASINTLTSSTILITNDTAEAALKFWRAAWLP